MATTTQSSEAERLISAAQAEAEKLVAEGAPQQEVLSWLNDEYAKIERDFAPGGVRGEIIAGTKEQRRTQQREAIRTELGLIEPIANDPVSPSIRAALSFAPSDKDKEAYLATVARGGKEGVRSLGNGRFLVLSQGPNPEWRITDPGGFDIGDVTADLAGEVLPTTAGTAAQLALTPARPFIGSAAGAGAANLVGGLQDIAFRQAVGEPINLPEIALNRGVGALAETAVGAAIPAVLSPLNQLRTLGRESGAAAASRQFASEGAEGARVLENMGIPAPMTAGERTGSLYLQETEAAARKLGRFGRVGQAIEEQQDLIAPRVRERFTQGSDIALAGESLAQGIRAAEQAGQAGVRTSIEGAAKAVEEELAKRIAASAPGTMAPLSMTQAGERVRNAFSSRLSALEQAENLAYSSFRTSFGASGTPEKFVKLGESEKIIDDILNKLVTTKRSVEGDLVDAKGVPITEEVEEVLGIYAPMKGVLEQIKQAANDSQKLESVLNLRTYLNQIGRAQGTEKSLESGAVKRLTQALTKDITGSIDEFTGNGSDALKQAWKLTRDKYELFERAPVLQRILNDPANGGFQNSDEIVRYFTQGAGRPDELKAVSQVLPAPEYNALRRAMIDDVLGTGRVQIGNKEFADLGAMGTKLKSLSPEVKDELYGSRKAWTDMERIISSFDDITQNRSIFVSEGLPDAEVVTRFQQAIDRNAVPEARKLLEQAASNVRQRQMQSRSALVNAVRRGDYAAIDADPHTFINDFLFSQNVSPTYSASIFDQLPAASQENVRKAAVDTMFNRAFLARESPLSAALEKKMGGAYDPNKLAEALMGSDRQQAAIRHVVGEEAFNATKAMLAFMKNKQAVRDATGSVGSFSRENVVGLQNIPQLLSRTAVAKLIYSPAGQKFLTGVSQSPERWSRFVNESLGAGVLGAASSGPTITLATIAPQLGVRQLQYAYLDATDQLTPEEKQAVDAWLFGD